MKRDRKRIKQLIGIRNFTYSLAKSDRLEGSVSRGGLRSLRHSKAKPKGIDQIKLLIRHRGQVQPAEICQL
jgi:hypothetical protein